MKKTLLAGILLFAILPIWAQNVQWAFKILDFSSQETSQEYSSKQLLGKPNVFPASGERITAWQPKGNKNTEFVKVGFITPIKAKQIVIAETFHPGFISNVYVYDLDGKEYEAASFKPRSVNLPSRLLQINVSQFNFFIVAVKIVVKPEKKIPIAIDAIGITTSTKPVEIKITKNDLIKSNMVAKRLGPNVNSPYPEHGPLISPDGKTLYYSRRFDPGNAGGVTDKEDIWYSNWDDKINGWDAAKNMGSPMNNTVPNFVNSISPDGNTLLLGNSYFPNGTSGDGVSICHKTSNGWTFPKKLNITDLNNVNEKANYYMSNTMKSIVMSIQQKGDNLGDRDLYVTFLVSDSIWTKPLNLGKTLNTIGTEAGPFLAADDRTLYFTSDGFGGYGGSDIYVTRRLDETWQKWSEPENLGPVINTSYDESFFSLSASGKKVYFTSTGATAGDYDIYTVNLAKSIRPLPVALITGRVLNSKTNEPIIGAKIIFENLSTGAEVGIARSNPVSGNYQIVLPSGSKYGYLAEKSGFISVHANIDLEQMPEYSEIYKDLYISPIEEGESSAINNIFFESDKYELKKESFTELNRLAKLLKNSPTLKIEIAGHTDNLGSEAYNDLLSYNRANAVVTYLVKESGVDKSRVSQHNYGESMPVANNSTSEGRHLNRRVEVKILVK